MKRTEQDLIGFEDGSMWPQAKDCEWPLDSNKQDKILSPGASKRNSVLPAL